MSKFAKVVIDNLYGKGDFISEVFDMGGFNAKIKLKRPIKNTNPVTFTVYILKASNFATEENKYTVNATQTFRILRKKNKDPIETKLIGDITINLNGDGFRPFKMDVKYVDVIAKGGIENDKMTIEFSIVPRKKKCSSVVGSINKVKLPENYHPEVRRNFYDHYIPPYNSKKETGFVGIRNQGATCYMNSILQTLYNLPSFRRLIYSIATTSVSAQDKQRDIILNLQSFFVSLQTSFSEVSSSKLTKSFGWGENDVFMQHDSTEFWGVLLNAIESHIKSKPEKIRSFNEIFQVITRTMAQPIGEQTQYQLGANEPSLSLAIRVQGVSSVEEGIRLLLAPSAVDDPIEVGGRRTLVTLNTVIKHLPKVLMIQLMRFTIDATGSRVKLDNRVSFTPFITVPSEEEDETLFTLHAVICHNGSAMGGHYFAYIRPTTDEQWFCFNDSRVTRASEEEAMEKNFDGSAYLLLYARADKEAELFTPVSEAEIPEVAKDYSSNESEIIDITIITNEALQMNASSGISGYRNDAAEKDVTVNKGADMSELLTAVSEKFNVARGSFLLWSCDATGRPESLISTTGNIGTSIGKSRILFLEENATVDGEGNLMIAFIKVFNPVAMSCNYIGSIHVQSSATMQEMAVAAAPELAPFAVFTEKEGKAERIQLETQFSDSRIGSGAFIVIQKDERVQLEIPEEPLNYLALVPEHNDGLYSTFLSLRTYVKLNFVTFDALTEPIQTFLCPPNISINELKGIAANFVGLDPESTLLYHCVQNGLSFSELTQDSQVSYDQWIAVHESVAPAGSQGMNVVVELATEGQIVSDRFILHLQQNEEIGAKLAEQHAIPDNARIIKLHFNRKEAELKPTDTIQDPNGTIRVIYNPVDAPFIDVSVDGDKARGRDPMFFSLPVTPTTNYEQLKQAIKTFIGVENAVFNRYRCHFNGNQNETITDSTLILPKLN